MQSNSTQVNAAVPITGEVNDTVSHKEDQKRRWTKITNPFRRRSRQETPVPIERQPSPEHKAGFFSLLTFQWMAPFMQLGYQRPLELNDIWDVNPQRSVPVMQTRLLASFERRRQSGDKTPLRNALYDTFQKEFLLGGFCSFIASLLQVLSPFTLQYLIQFATDAYVASHGGSKAPAISHGIAWAIGITLLQIVQTLCFNHFLYRGMIVGGQARAVLIALIFNKATKLSGRARAGGVSVEIPPPGMKPGSEEEKEWMQKNISRIEAATAVRPGWSNGRIVNLMSMDTSRVNQGSIMIHFLWTSPISILLALALLLVNITYSALPGFALLIIVVPLLARAIKVMIARRNTINTITDQRVSFTQEMLHGVQFVKYFGWESAFLDRLAGIRNQEISRMRVVLAIRHVITAVGTSMSTFATMLAFITFTLSGHELTSSRVFSSLSLFGVLSMPLNQFPQILGHVTDAAQSILRIEEFLLAEEAQDPVNWEFENENAVILENASFTWERNATRESDIDDSTTEKAAATAEQKKVNKKMGEHAMHYGGERQQSKVSGKSPTNSALDKEAIRGEGAEDQAFGLRDLNLTVGRHELVAVIGTVGSGKSSLLSALAGDMRKTGGSITLGASRGFCPQSAWIQNASVKENIIFGRKDTSTSSKSEQASNSRWYNDVLDACALRPDLDMFPYGDLTELGERGITISGGQKQRLNIARAIYCDADLILMDDPLSAVDAHVGRHIMDNAICGLLKDKCRILATHQLHVLHRCDRIVYVSEGRIIADGTFDHLMANNSSFQRMMASVVHEDGQRERHEGEDEDKAEESKSKQKTMKKNPQAATALMQAEERVVKSAGWSVYAAYVHASGTILNLPLMIILLIAAQGSNVSTSLWLSWWTSNKFGFHFGTYIGIYVALGFIQICSALAFYIHLTRASTSASRVMLQAAVTRVLRAPMSFFDTTPLGRITNRFSRDVDIMDNNLSDTLRNFLTSSGQIVAVFILVMVYFPYFAVALAALTIIFLLSVQYYRSSARELKRHDALLRSHVFTRFGEAVSGIPTIRAYGLEQEFTASVNKALDDMDGAYFLTFANQCWLSVRLDAIGNLMVLTIGILVVTSRLSVNPSISGLVLSCIISVVQYLQYSVRQFAEVENNMNSTERLHYYATKLEEEAPLHTANVRSTWPERGEIVFDDVQMRYRKDLPLILYGLNIRVAPGERVGIVGRTGAGKSSIVSALFRIVELSGGTITIDGINTATLGLHDLRSRLAIIPQEPILFQGTIRSNLDPFNKHTDAELWSALSQADLVDQDRDMKDNSKGRRIHLDALVEEEGANFSLGQRQLMALARALVRRSQIIVCDEATSSVDFETDKRVQRTIARSFKGKTLLCIAHRLKTVIGYDKICVMDAGKIVELDPPLALWEKGGTFRAMCDRSGIGRQDFNNSDEASFASE
ncbi:P-loop containing nucleoside triphosphate hydrolase protein [Truncatella angustata]|uniref:P-loop containing nucleoside triphosphate hydrolase protein n=1 Tax=Truncatella angustata TaxID=152316 RepID=A0A9P8RN73_9PEZI|nr:P-loop containing nucleoside triphosphate hydrolase protein [Truncatella angustata]KAH6646530.1 P-loop containing nucleoside triphosphate hydrolase protein [Truncatella angustata]